MAKLRTLFTRIGYNKFKMEPNRSPLLKFMIEFDRIRRKVNRFER